MIRSRRRAALFSLIVVIGLAPQINAQLGGIPVPPPAIPPPPPPVPPPVLPPPPQLDKFDPLLVPALNSLTGSSLVIVRARDAASVAAVGALIQQTGGTLGRTLSIIEAIAANVPNASLAVLSNNVLVRRIALDRRMAGTLERTGATIGASAIRLETGLDGTGIHVAVIDSGITPWHDDLADGPSTQRVDQFVDFVGSAPMPYDDFGHGTHVAGIIAGNGFDSSGRRSGIAPGARLTVFKVLNANGGGRISNLIAAIDYIVSHQTTLQVRVINVSVGSQVAESYNTDLLTQAAKRAVDAGIVVVAAAGNNGRVNGQTRYGAVAAPGNAPWVLTVGASSHQGTTDRGDDIVAPFSSRGPTVADHSAKPDVVAPGVGIESLSNPSSSMYVTRSSALRPGTTPMGYFPYLSLSGTSQATPVVSGTVALMLQANPALTPNAVKAILQFTAQNYAGYDALTQGAGFLNAYGAVTLARYFANPSASPYPDNDSWSHQIIWGNHRITGGRILPDANAWSGNVVWGKATQDTATVSWGVIWTPSDNETGGSWTTWGTSCGGDNCQTVTWGDPNSENVVWGARCGGADCAAPPPGGIWGMSDDDGVVWGTSDDDGVVWGTSDDDGVVWGTSCTDPSCES